MGFSLLTTHMYIAIALCGLSIASPSSTTDGSAEEAAADTTSLVDTTQSPALSTTNIDMSANTPIDTELIVMALIAIILCLIVICVALLIAIWKQSAQRHKDSEEPTISMRAQSVRNGLEAIEGKSPSCDGGHSAVVDMTAANIAAWDSTKSLSSMVSVQSQFYDAQFEAQLANAQFEANAVMLNAGGPLMFEIPEFVPEAVDAYVDDLDAMRYVDAFNMGMNDREVSAEDEDDDAVMLEMLTPTPNGQ